MRTLYTKLSLLVVLLLLTLKQNDPVATTRHFISFQNQPGVSEIPAYFFKNGQSRTGGNVRFQHNFNHIFSLNEYFSPGAVRATGICGLSSKMNIALVTGIIKVPLPISHLSGVVAYHAPPDDRIVRLDDASWHNVLCLSPGEGTAFANLDLVHKNDARLHVPKPTGKYV
ncbi:MAG: hypothetical protein ACTHLE_11260 [Agriterribacter sp.]